MKKVSAFLLTLVFCTWATPLVFKTDKGRAEYAWLKVPQSTKSLSQLGLDEADWQKDSLLFFKIERTWLPLSGGDHLSRFVFWFPFAEAMHWGIDGVLDGGEELQGYDTYGRETATFHSGFWGLGLKAQYLYGAWAFEARSHYLYSEIESYSSQAILFDLTASYQFLGWGFMLKSMNMGYGSSYAHREIVVPFGLRSALSYSFHWNRWLESRPFVGVHYQNDESIYYPLGLEMSAANLLQWRVSWAAGRDFFQLGTGLALTLPWAKCEYGFSSHEFLGGTHSFSLGVPF